MLTVNSNSGHGVRVYTVVVAGSPTQEEVVVGGDVMLDCRSDTVDYSQVSK